MKVRRKTITRFIAAFLALIYLFENTGWAEGLPSAVPLSNPLSKTSPILIKPQEARHLFLEDLIPSKEIGQIKALHQGKKDQMIVLIQDLHAHEEAQRNIANILDFLVRKHRLNLVGVEGASGQLNTRLFSYFSDKSAKKDVADYYLNQGRLSGSEYASIVFNPNLRLYGVEDEVFYQANLKSYLEVSAIREESLKILAETRKTTQQVGRFILSVELRRLFREREGFLRGNNEALKTYVDFLLKSSKTFLPNASWPKCEELARLIRLQSLINFETASAQVEELPKEILPLLPQEAQKKLLLEQKEQGYSHKTLWNELRKLSRTKQSKTIFKKYRQALSYLKLMMSYERMDGSFFDEIAHLEKALMEAWAKNPKEKSLVQLYLIIEAYENMFRLSMTKQNMTWFYENRESFKAQSFRNTLEPLMKQFHFSDELPENLELLEDYLPKAEKFYELAAHRDQVLISKAVNVMNENKSQLMAVVTGGFHTAGAENFLKINGYSYVVLTPSVKESWNEKELTEKYEKALNGTFSLFNTFFDKAAKQQNVFYQLSPRPLTPCLGKPLNGFQDFISLLSLRTVAGSKEPYVAVQFISDNAGPDEDFKEALKRLGSFGYEDLTVSPTETSRRFFFLNQDGTFNLVEFLPKRGKAKSFKELNLRRGAYSSKVFEMGEYRVVIVESIPSDLIPSNVIDHWQSIIDKRELLAAARSELRQGKKQFIPWGEGLGGSELESRVLLSVGSPALAEIGPLRGGAANNHDGYSPEPDSTMRAPRLKLVKAEVFLPHRAKVIESKLKVDRDPQHRIVLIEQTYEEDGKETVETTEFAYDDHNRLLSKILTRKENGKTTYSEVIPKGKFIYDTGGRVVGFKSVREIGGKVFFGIGTYTLNDRGEPVELQISIENFQGKLSSETWKYTYGKEDRVVLSFSQTIYTQDPEMISLLTLRDVEKVVTIPDVKHHPVEVPVRIERKTKDGNVKTIEVGSDEQQQVNLPVSNGSQGPNLDQTDYGVVFPQVSRLPSRPQTRNKPVVKLPVTKRPGGNPRPDRKIGTRIQGLDTPPQVAIPMGDIPDLSENGTIEEDNSGEKGRIVIPGEGEKPSEENLSDPNAKTKNEDLNVEPLPEASKDREPVIQQDDNSLQPGRIEMDGVPASVPDMDGDFDSSFEIPQPETSSLPGFIPEEAAGPHFLIKSLLFVLYYLVGQSIVNILIYSINSPALHNITSFNFFYISDFIFSTSLGDDLAKSGRLLASLSLLASPCLHLLIYTLAWVEVLFLKGIPYMRERVAKIRLRYADSQQKNISSWGEYRLAFGILRACDVISVPGQKDPISYGEAIRRAMPMYYLTSFLLMLIFPKLFTPDLSWPQDLYDYLFRQPMNLSSLATGIAVGFFMLPKWLNGRGQGHSSAHGVVEELSNRSELRDHKINKILAAFLFLIGASTSSSVNAQTLNTSAQKLPQATETQALGQPLGQIKLGAFYESMVLPYSSVEAVETRDANGQLSRQQKEITGYSVKSPITGRVEPSKGIIEVQRKAKEDPSIINIWVREGTHICFVTDSKLELEVEAARTRLDKARKELTELIRMRKTKIDSTLTIADLNPSSGAGLVERYLREGLMYAEKLQRLKAVNAIVAPEDGEITVQILPSKGNVNQKDALFVLVPSKRFSTQMVLSMEAFQEILKNQFNLQFEVKISEEEWKFVQIQKLDITLVPEREPYVIIKADLLWDPKEKSNQIRKRPENVRWQLAAGSAAIVSPKDEGDFGITATGIVEKRDIFPVAGSEIPGAWIPVIDEMAFVEGGKIVGKNDGVRELQESLNKLKVYGQFTDNSINLFSPKSLAQAQALNLPKVWDTAGFGENRGAYPLLWGMVETSAERDRLLQTSPVANVRVKNGGVYVAHPAFIRQPVFPGQEVGALLSGLVHVGGIRISKNEKQPLPKPGDLIRIQGLTGLWYTGIIQHIETSVPNQNGKNFRDEYVITDVLIPGDVFQNLGSGEPVKIKIPFGEQVQTNLKKELKNGEKKPARAPFPIQYQLGRGVSPSTALKLLKTSQDEILDILEQSDLLDRIEDARIFLSQKNHSPDFNRHLERMIFQNDPEVSEVPYRADVAQLAVLYLRGQGKTGITKLVHYFSELEKNPRADFAKSLVYQVIQDAVRKDPGLLATLIRESRFSEDSLRAAIETIFLRMIFDNPQDPASVMALQTFWDDEELRKYSNINFISELERRKQASALQTFATGYLLPAVQGRNTLAPLPGYVAEEGMLRRARLADARLLMMFSGDQGDWESGIDPAVRRAGLDAIANQKPETEVQTIDLKTLFNTPKAVSAMTEDPVFFSWDEETRKEKIKVLKADELARLLEIPQYRAYYLDIRDALIKTKEGLFYLANAFLKVSQTPQGGRTQAQKKLLELLLEKEFGLSVLLLTELESIEVEMDSSIQSVLEEYANQKEDGKNDNILLSSTEASQKAGFLNFYLETLLQLNKEQPSSEKVTAILRSLPSKFQLRDIFEGRGAISSKLTASGMSAENIKQQVEDEIFRRVLAEAISLIRQKFGIGQSEPGIQNAKYLELENIRQKISQERMDAGKAAELIERMKKSGSLDPKIYDELIRYIRILSNEVHSGKRFSPDLTVKKNPYFWIILTPFGIIGLGAFIAALAFGRHKRKIEKSIMKSRARSDRSEIRQSAISDKTSRPHLINSSPALTPDSLYEDSDLQPTLKEWKGLIEQEGEFSRFDISRLLTLVMKARRDKKIHFSFKADFLNHLDPDILIIIEEMLGYLEETQKKIQSQILELDSRPEQTKELKLRIHEYVLAMKELSYTAQYLIEFELIVNMLISLKRIPESYALTWLKIDPNDPKRNYFWTKFKIGLNRIGSVIFAFVRLHLFISPPAWKTRTRLAHHLEQLENKAELVDKGLYLKQEWDVIKTEIPRIFISERDVSHMPVPVLVSEWAKLGRRLFFLVFAGDLPLSLFIVNHFSNLNVILQPYLWIAGPLAAFGLLALVLAWTLHLWPMLAIFVGRYSEEHNYYKLVFNTYEKWITQFSVYKNWKSNVTLSDLEQDWTNLAVERELDLDNSASIHIVAVVHQGELSDRQKRRYHQLLGPLLRNEESLVFIRQNIAGSGGAYLSAKLALQQQLAGLKKTLNLEAIGDRELGIAYLLAGGEPTNVLSLIQGEDRYIPGSFRIQNRNFGKTTTRLALANAYKQAQQARGGEFILSTNADNSSPQFIGKEGMTLGSVVLSHKQIKDENLGMILPPHHSQVWKVIEKLKNRERSLHAALSRHQGWKYFLNMPANDEEELRWQHMLQWPAFDGNAAVSAHSVIEEILNSLIGRVVFHGQERQQKKSSSQNVPEDYYQTAQRLGEEHESFRLSLTLDVIIPILLAIHGEDLSDYLNTRTKGMDRSLENGYKRLAKILKGIIEIKVVVTKKGKGTKGLGASKKTKSQKKKLNFYHFPGYPGQTRLSNVTTPYFWSALYNNDPKDTIVFPDGTQLVKSQRGTEILCNVSQLNFGSAVVAAHFDFVGDDGTKTPVNYLAGPKDTFFGEKLFGKPWKQTRGRIMDRDGKNVFEPKEKWSDAPLYPVGQFNIKDFDWMKDALNGDGPVIIQETRSQFRGRRVSTNWILENRRLLAEDSASQLATHSNRSELRKAVIAGLDSAQKQTLPVKLLDERARRLEEKMLNLLKESLKDHYKVDLDQQKTFEQGYYVFEYDPDRHSLETVRELLSLIPQDVRFILTAADDLNEADKRMLYDTFKNAFKAEMNNTKNAIAPFAEKDWSNERLIRSIEKKMGNQSLLYLNDSRLRDNKDAQRIYMAATALAKQIPVVVGRSPQNVQQARVIDAFEILMRSKAQIQTSA